MTTDTESGDNHTMLLVYGIGLIVISGTACVYIAIRMTAMQPVKVTAFPPLEVRFTLIKIINQPLTVKIS